jgi:hypothetical protein
MFQELLDYCSNVKEGAFAMVFIDRRRNTLGEQDLKKLENFDKQATKHKDFIEGNAGYVSYPTKQKFKKDYKEVTKAYNKALKNQSMVDIKQNIEKLEKLKKDVEIQKNSIMHESVRHNNESGTARRALMHMLCDSLLKQRWM